MNISFINNIFLIIAAIRIVIIEKRNKSMKKILAFVAVVGLAFGLGLSSAWAVNHGSIEEAKTMAIRAAEFLKTNGKDKAFAAFNQGADGFKDRDLYVFAYDNAGVCVAHGTNPGMLGKNLINMKDADGVEIIKEFVKTKDAGWVNYKWANPETKSILSKSSYVIRVGDYIVGVGAYKD